MHAGMPRWRGVMVREREKHLCITGVFPCARLIKRQKGIWWMPWCQEAMKDVTRCEKPRGAASRH